jgi:periplasmic protein TonB
MLMSHAGRRGTTFFLSLVFHAGLAFALVVLPLLAADALPTQNTRVVCLGPAAIAAPPPPAAAAVTPTRLSARRSSRHDPAASVAPVVPNDLETDDAFGPIDDELDAYGVRDGVVGGMGHTIGSVIGDLPSSTTPSPPRVVRVGGAIAAPRLVRRVDPAYPAIAIAARLSARVELEAEVDGRGVVARVSVERGHPLFDEAAIAAVRQWRYQPLLLNGEPTAFILSVTVRFDLQH